MMLGTGMVAQPLRYCPNCGSRFWGNGVNTMKRLCTLACVPQTGA